jgi:hypothetical protein
VILLFVKLIEITTHQISQDILPLLGYFGVKNFAKKEMLQGG